MAKVIVLGGCGQVGSVAVRTLVVSDDFSEVVIGDFNIERAHELVAEIGSDKLSAVKVDAGDPNSIKSAISGCDLVLNCVGPFYRTVLTIMKAVIESGIDYVDISDDVSVIGDMFDMDEAAKQAGICALIGMGASPGVTNLIAKLAADYLLDEVDSIDIYHTHGGEPEEGPGVIGHRFHCMSVDCPMFLDGELKYVKFFEEDGIALREKVDFHGIGKDIQVYPYPHPEQVTIPRFIKANRVTNKGSVLPLEYYDLIKDMCRLGLSSEEPLEVKDQTIVPYDFAIAYILRERDRILQRTNFGEQRGSMTIAVVGKKDGKRFHYLFKSSHSGGKRSGLGLSTGIPAAVGTILMQQGKITKKGVLPPEGCVNPVDYFRLAAKYNELIRGTETRAPGMIVDKIDEAGHVERFDWNSLLV